MTKTKLMICPYFVDSDNVCTYVYRTELERLKEKHERFQKRYKNQTY